MMGKNVIQNVPATTRREFIKLLALGGAGLLAEPWGARAQTQPRGSTVDWARLRFRCYEGEKDDWNNHPQGDLNLIKQLNENTTINIRNDWNVVDIGSLNDMTTFPFLFMHAELPPSLEDAERANLREYMLRGGFLLAEDCVLGKWKKKSNMPPDAFFRTMSRELQRIMPEAAFDLLPNEHPIFHCFYDLPNGLPHMQGVAHGAYGLLRDGRLLALLSPSDNHCGWARQFFGEELSTAALHMGANIYVYAMTQMA